MSAKKTEYMRHQLNKSPSKNAYTFSKVERFPDAESTHYGTYGRKKETGEKSSGKSPSRFNVISRKSSRKSSISSKKAENEKNTKKSPSQESTHKLTYLPGK